MIEFWTVYNASTGAIRVSGSGPAGSGALQPLNAGEAVVLQAAIPGQQLVKKVGGALSVVANPSYVAPAAIIATSGQPRQSPDGTNWMLSVTNGGAVTATKQAASS